MIPIIEAIRTFICGCPFLKDGVLNVDYLGIAATEYSIDGVPTTTIIKKYADGGTINQYTFTFASREYYGEDTMKNIANSGFYEKFAGWLKTQSDARILPALDNDKMAQEIEAITSGYVFDGGVGTARYQVQCRLTYYEGGI